MIYRVSSLILSLFAISFLGMTCEARPQGLIFNSKLFQGMKGVRPYFSYGNGSKGSFIGSGAVLDPESLNKDLNYYSKVGYLQVWAQTEEGYTFQIRAAHYGIGIRSRSPLSFYGELGAALGSGRPCDGQAFNEQSFLYNDCEVKGFIGVMPEVGLNLNFKQGFYGSIFYRHIEFNDDVVAIPSRGFDLGYRF